MFETRFSRELLVIGSAITILESAMVLTVGVELAVRATMEGLLVSGALAIIAVAMLWVSGGKP